MVKEMSQTIYTCFQTAIQIFVFTMVFIKQHQIQEYRDKWAKQLTANQQNNLFLCQKKIIVCHQQI